MKYPRSALVRILCSPAGSPGELPLARGPVESCAGPQVRQSRTPSQDSAGLGAANRVFAVSIPYGTPLKLKTPLLSWPRICPAVVFASGTSSSAALRSVGVINAAAPAAP